LTAAVKISNEDCVSKSSAFGMAFDNWAKHQEIVTMILDRGADPNLVDKVLALLIFISCGNEQR
jgi:hypothetical protein